MLKILEDVNGKVVISVGIVELTKEDWEKLTSFLKSKVKLYDKIHWYLEIEDFRSDSKKITPVDDQFMQTYQDSFERIALVGNKDCHGWMCELVNPFKWAKVQFFEIENQDIAHKWIRDKN